MCNVTEIVRTQELDREADAVTVLLLPYDKTNTTEEHLFRVEQTVWNVSLIVQLKVLEKTDFISERSLTE